MSTCASSPRSPSKVSISNPTRRRPSPRISLVRNPLSATPSSRNRSARRPRTVVFPAPGRASIRRRAGTACLVPELLPLLALAQSGPFRDRQEGHRCDHGGHEADEVQLEDVPGVDQVGDRPAYYGAGEAEPERPKQADLLLAGQQQPCQKADDEPGDDESNHASSYPAEGGGIRDVSRRCRCPSCRSSPSPRPTCRGRDRGAGSPALSGSADSPTLSPVIAFAARPIPTAAPRPKIARAVPTATVRKFI